MPHPQGDLVGRNDAAGNSRTRDEMQRGAVDLEILERHDPGHLDVVEHLVVDPGREVGGQVEAEAVPVGNDELLR